MVWANEKEGGRGKRVREIGFFSVRGRVRVEGPHVLVERLAME